MKLSHKNIVSWSQFTTSLAHPHRRLGFKSSRSASPCGASSGRSVFRSLRARSSRASPLIRALMADVYVPNRPFSVSPGRVRCMGSSAWFLSCAFWICLQIVGVRLGKSCDGSVWFFWHVPPHTSPDFVFDPLLSSSGEVGSFLFAFGQRLDTVFCDVRATPLTRIPNKKKN